MKADKRNYESLECDIRLGNGLLWYLAIPLLALWIEIWNTIINHTLNRPAFFKDTWNLSNSQVFSFKLIVTVIYLNTVGLILLGQVNIIKDTPF